MRDPVLITGCPRSFTSMTAGIIDICGAFGGKICGPTKHNSKGQFENRMIVDRIVKPLLRSINADPMGQHPLPDVNHVIIRLGNASVLRREVFSIMGLHELKEGQVWYYKGAKVCLIWPLWYRAFPEAKWIWVDRDDESIIDSCFKTAFMRAFTTRDGWQYWINQHKLRFREMAAQAGLDMVSVTPLKMIKGDFQEMKSAIKWLGLTWKDDEIRRFVSPDLCHFGREK